MKKLHDRQRLTQIIIVLGLAISVSSCGWLRGKTGYENSPESRPLEVPPDLDTPRTDPGMQIPAVSSRAAAPSVKPAPSSSFVIADAADSAWRRLGLALERIDGAVITQKAQALSAYNVSYAGADFLLRVVAEGEGSRVEAVGNNGAVLSGGAAAELLGLLRARLG